MIVKPASEIMSDQEHGSTNTRMSTERLVPGQPMSSAPKSAVKNPRNMSVPNDPNHMTVLPNATSASP